jgi:hypothetical protein
MTITDFITARLDAKAWSAQAAKDGALKRTHYRASMIEHCDRELREVAAMRAILAGHPHQPDGRGSIECHTCDWNRDDGGWPGACPTVRHLAAIDRDHPDYDPRWAPEGATS